MELWIQRVSAFIILKDIALLSSSEIVSACTLSPDACQPGVLTNSLIFANLTKCLGLVLTYISFIMNEGQNTFIHLRTIYFYLLQTSQLV